MVSCTPPTDVDLTATVEPKPYRVINSKVESALDNYYFTGVQYKRSQVEIKLILYSNYDDIAKAAGEDLSVGPNEYIVAFSKNNIKENVCEIHMIDPEIAYRPEFTGHEMLHCFYGQFHGSNNTKG